MTAPSTDAHARLVLRDVSTTLADDGRHVVSRRLWTTTPPADELVQVAEMLEASAERHEQRAAEGRERTAGPSPIVMRAAATALRRLVHRDVARAVAVLAEREGQTTEEWLRAASAVAEDNDCDTNTAEAM